MIRKLFSASAAASGLLAFLLPASAADLRPVAVPPPAPVAVAVPAFSWTGWYIGGHAGAAWGEYDYRTFSALATGSFRSGDTDATFIGGGQIGFNWQSGIWVWGIEGDISGKSLKVANDVTPLFSTPFVTLEAKTQLEGSIRGRLGLALDRFLVYGTGGWAIADTTVTGCGGAAGAGVCVSDSQALNGWTAGVGGEFAVTNNVSLGVEYRYAELGKERFNFGSFGVFGPSSADVGLREHQVTGRLNIRFGSLFGVAP